MHKTNIAILTREINAQEQKIQLLPAGHFRSNDGRPVMCSSWRTKDANKVIDKFNSLKNKRVIDYEHQTLLSKENGKPAPAAGWFAGLMYTKDGWFATGVEWTAAAKSAIEAKEYKYISAVFTHDKKGEITNIEHASLTNNPAVDGMDEVVAASKQFFNLNEEEMNVHITELLKKLEIDPKDATKEQVDTVLAKLSKESDNKDEAIIALQQEINELKAATTKKVKDDLISMAVKEQKISPALIKSGLVEQLNVEQLTKLIETSTPILDSKVSFKVGGDDVSLSDEQLAMCKSMSIDPEEFAEQLKNKTV